MHRAASLLITLLLLAGLAASGSATPKKALFDYTKNETAGQADWIIDTHMPTPSPAQSGITPGTPESYWLGGISAWGVTMVKRGYTVATLTSSYGITYGNSSNPYDLSNYDVFIIPEPQNPFSAAETTAIYAFLRNGGGIVAVGDHNSSDRDSDGWDSPRIYNALDPNHVLGVHWQVTGEGNNNVSQVSTNVATSPGDSLIYGPAGTVANLSFHNGDTMVLYPGTNPSVRGEVWMNGVSQSSTSQVMAASAVYGNGRIVFVCDSSPMDDGSGQSGNSLYTGWTEAGTTDSTVFMNAALWVTRRDAAGDTTDPVVTVTSPNGGETWAAGSSHNITWTATDNVGVTTVDLAYSLNGGSSWTNIATGQANSGTYAWPVPQSPTTQALVRVKAYDAATNMGSDVSNAVFTIADQTAPTIAVTSPNGGEAWAAGSSHNITWTATDNVGVTAVDLAYSLNGGSSWTNIATGLANSGTYSWSVPQSPTTQALVRATAHDGDGNATADASDAVFTIADQTAPTVTVTSPNGGESWDAGSSHNITWIASDNVGVDSVNVDYSLRGPGGPWVAIQHGLPNSGTLSWTLPVDSSDSALVQVVAFDHALNHTADPSDALFQIAGTAVGVPGGAAGRLYLARPAPNPSSGTVRLRYSLPAASPVRLEVLDVIGRQVWVREATQESAGGHFADWNGRSASGAPAAAGLYFVRLVTSGGALTQRLVRMR